MRNWQGRLASGAIAGVLALSVYPLVAKQAQQLAEWQAVWPRIQLWRVSQATLTHTPTRQSLSVSTLAPQISHELAMAGLATYLHGLPQQQASQISFQLAAVPFDQAVTWLENMLHHYTLSVQRWQVVRTPALGLVNLQLTLRLQPLPQ